MTTNHDSLPFTELSSYEDWNRDYGHIGAKHDLPNANYPDFQVWWDSHPDLEQKKAVNGYLSELYDCDHHDMERVKHMHSNGSVHHYMECTRCGWAKITKNDGSSPQKWRDIDFYQSWYAQKSDFAQMMRERNIVRKEGEWWEKYNVYLKSERWENKRSRVLNRDNFICQGCLRRNATQVHHLKYLSNPEDFGTEPLWELVSICKTCHDYVHRDSPRNIAEGEYHD